MPPRRLLAVLSALSSAGLPAQDHGVMPLLLTGAQVLDAGGEAFVQGRAVLLREGRIGAILPDHGPPPEGVETLDLSGCWLIPGLIDLHSHLLLRPYDQVSWEDQVLKEALELRAIRATVAARDTLQAGFTTLRDLGTEGAGFADVALRDAFAQGLVPGPRLLVATRAIVATGCYGPSGFDPRWTLPKGAQEADGIDGVRVAVRQQIAAGADWIKVYADYRRGSGREATPTFSQDELRALCEEAASAGVPVAAHASTDEGARRAVLAGVRTIEHGQGIGAATLELMRERGVALCPTLAAHEAILRYRGVNPPAAARMNPARVAFRRALDAGVTIACGSDVGVFAHGDNARELELMVACGMSPAQALAAATRTAAAVLGRGDLGQITAGAVGDLVALAADPLADIAAVRRVRLVVQGGVVVRR